MFFTVGVLISLFYLFKAADYVKDIDDSGADVKQKLEELREIRQNLKVPNKRLWRQDP
jgi:hypothetical protein